MKTNPKSANSSAVARRQLKIVEWSDEDVCFVGSAPPIIGPCCHGRTETAVMVQLATIVEEWTTLMLREGDSLSHESKVLGFPYRLKHLP